MKYTQIYIYIIGASINPFSHSVADMLRRNSTKFTNISSDKSLTNQDYFYYNA